MDFENERYVRVYTTDTVNRLLLPWEARHVLDSLWRKFDRAGVIDIGYHDPVRAIAALLGDPQEFVAGALGALIDGDDPPLELRELDGRRYLVAPNFMAGQEAKQSDKARQKAAREKRRATARLEQLVTPRDGNVTGCDAPTTRRDEAVTPGHAASHDVTRGHSVPSCAQPSCAVPTGDDAPPPDDADPRARDLLAAMQESRAARTLGVPTIGCAESWLGIIDAKAIPIALAIGAIRQANADADAAHGSPDQWTAERYRKTCRVFIENAKRRTDSGAVPPINRPPPRRMRSTVELQQGDLPRPRKPKSP